MLPHYRLCYLAVEEPLGDTNGNGQFDINDVRTLLVFVSLQALPPSQAAQSPSGITMASIGPSTDCYPRHLCTACFEWQAIFACYATDFDAGRHTLRADLAAGCSMSMF